MCGCLGFSDVANEVCLQFLAKGMWPGCLVSRKRGVGLCLAKWVCPVCLVEIGVWPSKRVPHTQQKASGGFRWP